METFEGLTIRMMSDGDMAAIVEIDKKIVGRARVASWPQKVSSHFKTYYPPLSFVAEVDNKVVGFIIGVIMGAEYGLPLSGWINIIGVDSEYQGHGVARMLTNSFIQACRRRGIKARLMVRQKDEDLKKVLVSLGFKQGDLVDFVRGFS
ncbi:MAG: GNAT family N-acetyltransferase [Chloroflexi bacterium]|nr:GNAT family N-acetyltransferase [Chloroflexota bacterium]